MLRLTEKQKQIVEMRLTGATYDAIPATKEEILEAEDRYFGIDNAPEFDWNIDDWTRYIFGERPTLN